MISYKSKVIVIGPGGVGKTSLINRFVKDRFTDDYKLTIGVDFLTKDIELENDQIARLTLWDVGGQDQFKGLRPSFYANAHGAMLVFDLSRDNTLPDAKTWLIDMFKYAGRIPFVFIGNKSDLKSTVEDNAAKTLAEENGGIYIKTSAKTGKNVLTAFMELTNRIVDEINKK